MPKKLVILKHGGGELANQLWNYVSIYAFGLEVGASVRNPSFFEYHSFFRFLSRESWITRLTSLFFRAPRRRSSLLVRNARWKHAVRAKIVATLNRSRVISSENSDAKKFDLPPTAALPERFASCDKLYFEGWLFRNSAGLKKHGATLREAFAPVDAIGARVDEIILPLRKKYEKIVGIHIRQADYKEFKDGKYLISQERVREIVSEYAKENILDAHKTAFVITSDGPVDQSLYKNLNVHISKENAVVDLFLLSRCDVILGSDSTFGGFASWYGDIPHIIFKNEPLDWVYYADKRSYFENRYSALARY